MTVSPKLKRIRLVLMLACVTETQAKVNIGQDANIVTLSNEKVVLKIDAGLRCFSVPDAATGGNARLEQNVGGDLTVIVLERATNGDCRWQVGYSSP